MSETIHLGPERWVHRLIVRENGPGGRDWTEEELVLLIGKQVGIKVWHEQRTGYFVAEFELADDCKTAVLTLDLYDMTGFAIESPVGGS